ncbi:MAG: NYN domain-containing protein [Porticoccaceae bacterium]|jgi:uncharacterized LabA/DUF88 family protein|nr:NYN domain-containing protein [Porticoccaceae bacterium]
MKKLAVFVDVQNIYYTVKQHYGCHFNYSALWRQLEQGLDEPYEIVLANAYAIARNDPRQQVFQQILRDIGFEVKLKPYIQRADGSAKGDWDVGITIDVMDAVAGRELQIDRVVLLSGDGDFDLLLKRIKQGHGVNSTVYAVSALTATSLIDAATEFRPIEESLLLR